jgi:hypothetical protein
VCVNGKQINIHHHYERCRIRLIIVCPKHSAVAPKCSYVQAHLLMREWYVAQVRADMDLYVCLCPCDELGLCNILFALLGCCTSTYITNITSEGEPQQGTHGVADYSWRRGSWRSAHQLGSEKLREVHGDALQESFQTVRDSKLLRVGPRMWRDGSTWCYV